ncbi:MAG TPA: 50S ribosomal protein L29 [Candidatus Saccharimonadales bacterium]|nr:50S ribosomal protein L29 [Candidatus Saccharimonadales bacterium]
MKTQFKKELHTRTVAELTKQLKDARNEQRSMQLDREMGKLKNTSALANKRLEIAVISTIINEKLAEVKLSAEAGTDDKKNVSVKVKSVEKKVKNEKAAKVDGKKDKPASAKVGKGGKNE